MRKIILTFISFVLILGGTVSCADLAGYTIKDYIVRMELNEDGSMDVQESIDVNFSESRHGIYRTIPYYSPTGRYTIIENLRVEGDSAKYYTENNTYNLRIGDANKMIIGDHTYIIKYRVKNAIGTFGSGYKYWTELYRNVIGTDRATTIDRVSFSISLPKSQTFGFDDYFWRYGKADEKKTDNSQISIQQSGLMIVGDIYARLGDYEGATVGLKFPADYFELNKEYLSIKAPQVTKPKINYGAKLIRLLKEFGKVIGKAVGLVILFLIFAFFGTKIKHPKLHSKSKQKYKSKRPITIYYTPPKNIDLSLANELYFKNNQSQIYTALFYFFASQGYILIKYINNGFWSFKKSYYCVHIGPKYSEASGVNQKLLNTLRPIVGENGNPIDTYFDLSENNYTTFNLRETIIQNYTNSGKSKYYIWEERKFVFFSRDATEKLNEIGIDICEQIRGFEYFLKHVERPYLEQMLKEDPLYVDKVLPRAVLFGVETEFLKEVNKILQASFGTTYVPDRYYGDMRFSTDIISIVSYREASSNSGGSDGWSGGGGSSGFSGGGGQSGGGGGGGGGGSW
ncbi:hypothetical protein AGMMS50249_2920 [candidate division SR1 bacterium]|nr:hypothetical protein AGMMS50249_2920 [candidate division SR1 bacterium]